MSFLHLFLVGLLLVGSIAGPVPDLSGQSDTPFQAGSKEDNQAGNTDGYTNESPRAAQYSPGDGAFQASNNEAGEPTQAESGVTGEQQGNNQPALYNLQGTTNSQASPTGTPALVQLVPRQDTGWNSPQSSQFYMGGFGGVYPTLGPMQSQAHIGSPDVTPTVPLTGPGPNQGEMQVFPIYSNQPFESTVPGFYSMGPDVFGLEQYAPVNQFPVYRMTNTQQVGHGSSAGYYPNPVSATHVAQQRFSQQQQAQTHESAGQQTTLQNAGQHSDPLSEILPAVITEKRRLGDEETQYSQSTQQAVQQPVQQTVSQVGQQPVPQPVQQPTVGYQPPNPVQQQYTEEQFPSLITLKGHNYLVVPQKYFTPYGGGYQYSYRQPYAVYTPYRSYTPYSPYSPYSSYAYTHTVPVVLHSYGVPTQQRYQLFPVSYSQNTGYPNLYSGMTTVKVLVKTDDTNGSQRTPYQTIRYGDASGRHSHYEEYGGHDRHRDYQPYGGYPHGRYPHGEYQHGGYRHSVYPQGHTFTSGYRVGHESYQPRITYPYQYSPFSGQVLNQVPSPIQPTLQHPAAQTAQ